MFWFFHPSIEDCTKLFFCLFILICFFFELFICFCTHRSGMNFMKWLKKYFYLTHQSDLKLSRDVVLHILRYLELSWWFGINAKVFLNWLNNSDLQIHNLKISKYNILANEVVTETTLMCSNGYIESSKLLLMGSITWKSGLNYLDLGESLLAFVTPCFRPFTAMSRKGGFFTIMMAETCLKIIWMKIQATRGIAVVMLFQW